MKKFIEFLNNKNNQYQDLIITGIEYSVSSNLLTLKAQYTCNNFSDELRLQLNKDVAKFFDDTMQVECKIKKYIIDADVITEHIKDFIALNYPSVLANSELLNINVNKIDDGIYSVVIELDVDNYAFLIKNDFEDAMQQHLSIITKEEYEITLKCMKDDNESDAIDILEQRYSILNKNNVSEIINYEPIEVSNIHNVVGEIDVDFVEPIATLGEQQKAVFVGKISYWRVSEYESRFKGKDGKPRIAKRVNFVLKDGSGKINCVYFPNIADEEKIEELGDEELVVVVGDITDTEERGLSCKIKSIALCTFEPFVMPEKVIEQKTVNKDYLHIFPKPYVTKTQSDLFVQDEKIDDFLLRNTVVVFDLETTGLNVNECEIIEIGAVKMVGGKVVETFDTLIKPNKPIPPDATAVNHITDEMVQECLGIDFVFPDFYKFIDGAILVAYNIDYDYGCLKAYGDRNGYVIANKQVDALKLAKKALPEYKSHKLGKVVKVLNITLDNAHRALFDTIATAEVLKATLNMLSDDDKKILL